MRSFFTIFCSIVLLAVAHPSCGQYYETLISDRPGKAFRPFTPGKSVFLLQSGVSYSHVSESSEVKTNTTNFYNDTEFRWGLLRNFEVNANFQFSNERLTIQDSLADKNSGLSDLTIGTRYIIFEGERAIPTISFQASVLLNLLSSSFNPRDAAPSFMLLTHQRLGEKISLVTNAGMSWNGNNSRSRGDYALNLTFAISPKYGAIIENYGNLENKEFKTYFDAGVYYLLSNNFQVDLSGGLGHNHGATNLFATLGFSWRFKKDYYYIQEHFE